METAAIRVGVYARISDDPENDELGVQRQLKHLRELVTARGGAIAREYVDNDVSAFKGRHRPQYEALMQAVTAGELTHIATWQTSRLWRRRSERGAGIERLATARVSVLVARGPDLDMTTAYGRGMAGLVGEFDTMESEVKSERIQAKVVELADAGRIANGGPRPFGFRRIYFGEGPRRKIVRDELDEVEAEIVRQCAAKVLRGESLRSIVGDLNGRGVKTSTGGLWTMQGLKFMLRSGRIAGLREHRRKVVGPAVWPAIVTVDEHEQLRALLDSNVRPVGSRVRCHYLTGFMFCSDCVARNVRMRVGTHHDKLKYICPPKAEGGCNGRVIGVADVEGLVKKYMVGRLNDPRSLRMLAEREATEDVETRSLLDAIEVDERRLVTLQATLTDGDEDEAPEAVAAVRRVRARLKGNRASLSRLRPISALDDDESLPELGARWDDLHIDRKQSLMRLFVQQVVIGPGRRGLGRFDPDRVDIVPVRRR
jgi:DNA invertase Pin-like site-specific DNA recombinase